MFEYQKTIRLAPVSWIKFCRKIPKTEARSSVFVDESELFHGESVEPIKSSKNKGIG
jgi:hypothetical protein